MKYKGIELVEYKTTVPVLFIPPKKMLVWDSDTSMCAEIDVSAFLPHRESYPVVGPCCSYRHCAEIPEEKPMLATNLRVARWLADGNGQVDTCPSQTGNNIGTWYSYEKGADGAYADGILVRKWGDTAWHAPTPEYLGDKE